MSYRIDLRGCRCEICNKQDINLQSCIFCNRLVCEKCMSSDGELCIECNKIVMQNIGDHDEDRDVS